MSSRLRVSVFVDGFNLYHAIDELGQNYLKWLDLRNLSNALVHPQQEVLNDVFYFSAFATWRPKESLNRHRTYVSALEATNVTPVMGKFKAKKRTCRNCKVQYDTHEEKESDVNLAIYLINQAHLDTFDRAIVVTADTDLTPAVTMVRDTYPEKKVWIAIPTARKKFSQGLQAAANGVHTIRSENLPLNLLPAQLRDKNDQEINRPSYYCPPG